jgi:hypothetical protein
MKTDPIPPQILLEKTYNAAADHYDQPPLSFWDRFGRLPFSEQTFDAVISVFGIFFVPDLAGRLPVPTIILDWELRVS